MSDALAIERYCAYRDRNPQDWELNDDGPVFDKGDFANDRGSATYDLSEEIR